MNCIIQFVFVHPEGYVDRDRLAVEPDYIPNERVEDYDIRQSESTPQVGDTVDFDGLWRVTKVESYLPVSGSTLSFYSAICTQDGIEPIRNDWSCFDDRHVLVFHMKGDRVVTYEDGSPWFSVSVRVPDNAILFKPEGDRPIQGFDFVAIIQESS